MLGLGEVTFFVDAARSGKVPWEEREANKAPFEQLRPGDHLIIAKLVRAFRCLSDWVAVLERFERMKIRLHIVNLLGDAIDLSSPMGRFLIHILAAFAELKRAFISERTKDGLARRKTRNVARTRFTGYRFRWRAVRVNGTPTLPWKEIADHLTYDLKLRTRVRRACRAELQP
jgi:DNA invertase Pin-like site-specific DNA recombinase